MTSRNDNPAPSSDSPLWGDIRCGCGRLLSIRRPQGYEVKCTRCKQIQLLPCDCATQTSQD